MRKDLLAAIYQGDYPPADKVSREVEDREYREAAEEYEQFKRGLSPEQAERLDKMLEANGSAEAANDRENFVEGARFGARLILELLGIDRFDWEPGGRG